MKFTVLPAFITLAVAGCDTRPLEQLGYADRQHLAREITGRCLGMGIKERTKQMEDCTRAETEKEFAVRSQWREELSADPYIPTRPINCRSTRWGSTINTSCY